MRSPVAIVGLGALFPGSERPDGFWRTIVSGRDCLTDVPPQHWLLDEYYDPDPAKPGKTYARRGAFLGTVPFEPLEYGIPPNAVPSTDTAQLLALMVARQVLENGAAARFPHVDRDRTSVILGVASATELVTTMGSSLQRPVVECALREEGFSSEEITAVTGRIERSYVDWTENTFPGLLGNVVAGRIANRFDLGGANCVVDAACASSLGAVRMAMQELGEGSADLVLTGGVDAINDIFMYMCFSKTLAMSRSGDCRPFASDADGTMLGEGIAMFALRRLEDAERDGDPIYAVIRGIGASSDGRARSIYAPRAAGQAKALRRAYDDAGYQPSTVELLEAHGTGTAAGDTAECEALKSVFTGPRQACALGSVKSQIGHTKSAAGAASLYKAAMSLHHKVLPATLKIKEPNPALGLTGSPFYLNTELRPWIRGRQHPRRAGVSSFGFGGSNFHLTLEEYSGEGNRPLRIRTLPSELFLASGATESEALSSARAIAEAAKRSFTKAAHESQRTFRTADPVRFAYVARDASDLDSAMRSAAGQPSAVEGGIAFLFPGQGSQFLNMGAALAMAFEEAIEVWDDAATSDPALPRAVFPPPVFSETEREMQAAALTETQVAQPALAATERMYLALLRAAGIRPAFCAGHSFGEVTALYAAGVLSSEDFMAVGRERGRLMALSAGETSGAMVAIAASASELDSLLPDGVTVANVNSPRQVVLAGTTAAIQEVSAHLEARGFSVHPLPVATAFHSPIVAGAVKPFTDFLAGIDFAPPALPVYSNTTAQPYPASADEARSLLGSQLARPVLFAQQIEALYQAGARTFIEVGPGSVLTGLTSACLAGRPHTAVALGAKGKDAVTAFWMGLAKLALAGIPFSTEFAWRDYEHAPEPPAPSPLAISISGTNYGKKYPRTEERPIVRKQAPPTAPVPPQAPPDDARISAIRQIQEHMAESHAATQRALSESHLAYLKATEAMFSQLGGHAPSLAPLPPAPLLADIETGVFLPEPVLPEPVLSEPTPVPPLVSAAIEIPDLTETVMTIVAAKTGYPREILEPSMDLEADLGIDSIKRVEILAAVSNAHPALPQADAKNMANLRTLGAILDFLGSATATAPAPALAEPAVDHADLPELVLGIVAEKTGYPRDILTLDMDLEADLGIDSIKRVQILAALQEARPGLPQVDSKQMGSLRTLGAILNFLRPEPELKPQPAYAFEVPVRLPEKLSRNGLSRLGLREIGAAPIGDAPPALSAGSRVSVAGTDEVQRNKIAEGLRRKGITVFANGHAPAGLDATVFVSSAAEADLLGSAALAFEAARVAADKAFITIAEKGSPLRSGLAALAKTVALEHPAAFAKAICLDHEGIDGDAIAEEILRGAHRPGPTPEIVLRPAGRVTFEEISLPIGSAVDTSLLQGNPLIVVSGGARGVTASCLLGLAEVAPVRFALLGRSPVEESPMEFAEAESEAELKAAILQSARQRGQTISPREFNARLNRELAGREIRATLAGLRKLGSEAVYVSCDVTNTSAVAAALSEIRRKEGPVSGLIHGAGIVADKRIADKTPEQFRRVFATKVLGLRNLLAALESDPLRLLLFFSSVAGRYGNIGQADYAMANATLGQMAVEEAARRGSACLVRALGWGPWDGGMVTTDLRAHFEKRGVPVIPMDRGVAAFVQELCHLSDNPAEIDVVLAGHLS